MRIICAAVLLSSVLFGQILYEEHFTGGAMQLEWFPWVDENMNIISDPTTPGGDDWAGAINNNDSVPLGATYAGDSSLTDYSVEAWIYTVVNPIMAPYNGLCIRIIETSLYQLASDFDGDARLRLRLIVGSTPTVIRDWSAGEIPGGVPASSSWHKFRLTMIGDSIWAYYDDVLLPGCPFIDATISAGYFGVYVFGMLELSSTKCDDIIVTAEGTGIAEYHTATKANIVLYPNPFREGIEISCRMTDIQMQEVRSKNQDFCLKIYDVSGRVIKSFNLTAGVLPLSSTIFWDGKDVAGNSVAPGIYFITDTHNNLIAKAVKLQ